MLLDDWPAAIYAIGDVHGCLDLLIAAEQRVLADAAAFAGPKLIVMLGDYVDRGPKSAGVIDHLQRPLAATDTTRVCLRGNHDQAFADFIDDPTGNLGWLEYGGEATLRSYGIDAKHVLRDGGGLATLAAIVRETVPDWHRAWLMQLPVLLQAGDVVFAHAGVQPGIPIAEQDDLDLMWIREPFLADGPQLPLTVIHGHTPAKAPSFGPGRIGIDTAAFATGILTALRVTADGSVTVL